MKPNQHNQTKSNEPKDKNSAFGTGYDKRNPHTPQDTDRSQGQRDKSKTSIIQQDSDKRRR